MDCRERVFQVRACSKPIGEVGREHLCFESDPRPRRAPRRIQSAQRRIQPLRRKPELIAALAFQPSEEDPRKR